MADSTAISPANLDFVSILVSTSVDTKGTSLLERRFQKDITIANLKNKLELLTGGSASTMAVELYNMEDTLIAKLDEDEAILGSYPIQDGMRLHIVDEFLLRADLEAAGKEDKYELPVDEYNKRPDTLKAYLERNRIGKYKTADKPDDENVVPEDLDNGVAKETANKEQKEAANKERKKTEESANSEAEDLSGDENDGGEQNNQFAVDDEERAGDQNEPEESGDSGDEKNESAEEGFNVQDACRGGAEGAEQIVSDDINNRDEDQGESKGNIVTQIDVDEEDVGEDVEEDDDDEAD